VFEKGIEAQTGAQLAFEAINRFAPLKANTSRWPCSVMPTTAKMGILQPSLA
jgi:hypothetical protein